MQYNNAKDMSNKNRIYRQTAQLATAVAAACLLSGHAEARVAPPATGTQAVAGIMTDGGETAAAAQAGKFSAGKGTFMLNGKPFVVKAAELHYPRIPRPYWEHRIQMCKALGMNTVCIYVFWNLHEPEEGHFDFTGNNDVAEFCRIAQRNGMYVIVRPGPYVCAEWEMGGLPWWLLKKKDIRLREPDPYFMERVKRFEEEVGRQLAPLTIGHGGPIIMVQVENEYGAYGKDKQYVSAIRDILKDAGFGDVMMFQCDWSSNFTDNALDDLLWTINFGTGADIDEQFAGLRRLRPDSPLMCSEYWSGWFDKWGAHHETRPAADMVKGIDRMLSQGISFSLYMTHGGTSFGHWAGANTPGYAPDVTSYDYDAPVSEWGEPTPKYNLLRQTLAKYADGPLPDVPAPAASLITIPETVLTEHAEIDFGADSIYAGALRTFEDMDMGYGQMIYYTSLPALPQGGTLTVSGCHDYARVFVDGRLEGTLDRRTGDSTLTLRPTTDGSHSLTMLVEGMGRINFGRGIKDYKGITGAVTLTAATAKGDSTVSLTRWINVTVPDGYANACRALDIKKTSGPSVTPIGEHPSGGLFANGSTKTTTRNDDMSSAGFYRGHFNLSKTGDTFIDMSSWGKGMLYVNGHAIGRFWNIGPQQTLYVPGCWLREGDNEVIVFDIAGPDRPVISGRTTHVLDSLGGTTADSRNGLSRQPDTAAMTPIAEGKFNKKGGWKRADFGKEVTGRHIAFEILSTRGKDHRASVAEIYAIGADGQRTDRTAWTLKYASSEDTSSGNHTAEKAFDQQESTYWRTAGKGSLPHIISIDMGREVTLTGIEYLPRTERKAPESVAEYRIYVY